jgi:hypothetical protein
LETGIRRDRVTSERYSAYCHVRDELDELGADLHGDERDLLRQTSEDLLLARPGQRDVVEDARQQAALALSVLAASRRLTSDRADDIWCLIADCGPASRPEPAPLGV